MVFGVRLAGGTESWSRPRVMTVDPSRVSRRRRNWPGAGFRAPPVTPVVDVGFAGRARRGSSGPAASRVDDDSPAGGRELREVFARLMAELAELTIAPPLPNPRLVRWDHNDSGRVAGDRLSSTTGIRAPSPVRR
jgi:hypothetical protein